MDTGEIILYPVKMLPAFKDYIWGGNKLAEEWSKPSPYSRTAESWELSAHRNGESVANNGPLKGIGLSELIGIWGTGCLGSNFKEAERFPILIKLIDPKQKLSVQVHPGDGYALAHEGDLGKTEMWYIAEAGPTGSILCGFREDIDEELFRKSIDNNSIVGLLNKITVKKGDVFLIEPGTVHAICEDVIITEIQQNSDVTYRVYDYDRRGDDGNPRDLHIDKAADISNFKASHFDGSSQGLRTEEEYGYARLLVSCKYFSVYEHTTKSENSAVVFTAGEKSFHALTFLDGRGVIRYNNETEYFEKGDTFFIPANFGDYRIEGRTLFLLTEV